MGSPSGLPQIVKIQNCGKYNIDKMGVSILNSPYTSHLPELKRVSSAHRNLNNYELMKLLKPDSLYILQPLAYKVVG